MKMLLIALMALNLSANIARAQGDAAPAGAEAPTGGDKIVRKKDKKSASCPHCKEEHGDANHKAHHHDKHPHDEHDEKHQ